MGVGNLLLRTRRARMQDQELWGGSRIRSVIATRRSLERSPCLYAENEEQAGWVRVCKRTRDRRAGESQPWSNGFEKCSARTSKFFRFRLPDHIATYQSCNS